MRLWNFGLYAAQHAAISYQLIGTGRSIAVYGSAQDQEQGAFNVDGTSMGVGVFWSADTSFSQIFVNVEKELLKAKLGQIPILVKVEWGTIAMGEKLGFSINCYRFINGREPTQGDASNRYRDRTGLVTWYEDAYAPVFGRDVEIPAALARTGVNAAIGERIYSDVTSIFERALRDNVDVDFLFEVRDQGGGPLSTTYSAVGDWPDFNFYYFYPIEFYQDDGAGEIDLLSVVDDLPGNEYYLGAVERDQTSAPVKGHFRNYTDATQQVEIFDDHPEFETPVQRAGSGTGLLDYVVLSDNAVSQLYTAVFYSPTQFEVKAETYRDNPISLHPAIDADSNWRGDTSTDFAAPEGGFSIPAAAWQKTGIATSDEFESGIRGNTTNTDWPADSNDQVEMTFDDAGSADSANWRPVTGRRIKSAAAVTIDGTTKLIPTRHVLPTDWPIGNPAFIHNASDYDAGVVKSVQEADIGTPVFSGTGTDDLTVEGNHNGVITDDYVVEIDAAGTPGTFQWSNDGGSTQQATGVVPTGSPQLLEAGIYVTIPTGTSHALADTWTIAVAAFAVELEGLTSGSTVYAPNSIVATTLPFRDVLPAVFSQVTDDSGASESPASRVYLSSTAGFTQGDPILLQQAGGISETATIATGGVQADYLDLTASLANDYSSGDFVTKTDGGATPFWMRAVASSTTIEELKTLRLNARML